MSLDKKLQNCASAISKSGGELLQARKVQSNIAIVITQLKLCLPVLTTYSKLKKQIAEKRYYPALKTLEELEHLHLPHVTNYRFCLQLRESIPKYLLNASNKSIELILFFVRIRDSIEQASMSDLKDFLENIRRFSPKIGEVAMRHVTITNKSNAFLLNFFFFADKRTNGQRSHGDWKKKETNRSTATWYLLI